MLCSYSCTAPLYNGNALAIAAAKLARHGCCLSARFACVEGEEGKPPLQMISQQPNRGIWLIGFLTPTYSSLAMASAIGLDQAVVQGAACSRVVSC